MARKEGSVIRMGEILSAGDYIESPRSKFFATMQSDGNFVVYEGSPDHRGRAVWAALEDHPPGKGEYFAIVQSDANFVVYEGSPEHRGRAVWASNVLVPIDPSCWMQQIGDKIAGRHPGRLYLPGTHGSGSYSWQMTIGVRNQDKNFGEQLVRGIRYLDLRVILDHIAFPGYYLCHNGVTASDLKLRPALVQVRDFIDKHPKEIVLLGFNRLLEGDADHNMSKKGIDALKGIIRECFKDKLVERPDNPTCLTVKDIWDKNQNIIAFIKDGKEDLWSLNDIEGAWDPVSSDFWKLPEEKIPHLHNYMTKALKERSGLFFNMALAIWTINLWHAATYITNPNIPGWIDKWFHDPSTKNNMNAIAVDFFDQPHGKIVQKVIGLNK